MRGKEPVFAPEYDERRIGRLRHHGLEGAVLTLFAPLCEDSADSLREKKERRIQSAVLSLRRRFGKNAVLKGMNFKEGATAIERNKQIGGHRA